MANAAFGYAVRLAARRLLAPTSIGRHFAALPRTVAFVDDVDNPFPVDCSPSLQLTRFLVIADLLEFALEFADPTGCGEA
jgi:hypothetical protein